jgi:hypothetical protein
MCSTDYNLLLDLFCKHILVVVLLHGTYPSETMNLKEQCHRLRISSALNKLENVGLTFSSLWFKMAAIWE